MYRYELIKGLYYIVEENEIKKGRFINCECLWRLSISERSPPISLLPHSLPLSLVCMCSVLSFDNHSSHNHPSSHEKIQETQRYFVCVCVCMHVLVCMSVCGRTCVHSLTEKIRGNNPPPPPLQKKKKKKNFFWGGGGFPPNFLL